MKQLCKASGTGAAAFAATAGRFATAITLTVRLIGYEAVATDLHDFMYAKSKIKELAASRV